MAFDGQPEVVHGTWGFLYHKILEMHHEINVEIVTSKTCLQ